MFKGSMVALITPMHEDGSVDKTALKALVDWHLAAKTDAIIAVGTTGESATLNPAEHFEVIELVVKQVAGKIPVIAGTGTNSTHTTIELTKHAKKAGANAALIVTPYYNKPTQNGLIYHYKAVADTVDLPIILYNVPSRTACDLLPETVQKLSLIKNIIGIKEATGKIERVSDILNRCGKDFAIYSGDDETALELIRAGGHGVISVTANVAPQKMVAMCKAALEGKWDEASSLNDSLALLHKRLFVESNPIPTKWALQAMHKIQSGIRLPLLPLDQQYHQTIKEALVAAGVETV